MDSIDLEVMSRAYSSAITMDLEAEPIHEVVLGDQVPSRTTHALFVGCTAAGALIWFVSPSVLGQREPWDAALPYTLYLTATAVIAGLIAPKCIWPCPFGFSVGQTVGLCALPKWGSLISIGFLVFVPLTGVVSLFGVMFGASVRHGLENGWSPTKDEENDISVIANLPAATAHLAELCSQLPPEVTEWSESPQETPAV